MSYAMNAGVRIHFEVEGGGPPLLLHTGFASSVPDWYTLGYVDALKGDYQLILLDPRGQGQRQAALARGLWARAPSSGCDRRVGRAQDRSHTLLGLLDGRPHRIRPWGAPTRTAVFSRARRGTAVRVPAEPCLGGAAAPRDDGVPGGE